MLPRADPPALQIVNVDVGAWSDRGRRFADRLSVFHHGRSASDPRDGQLMVDRDPLQYRNAPDAAADGEAYFGPRGEVAKGDRDVVLRVDDEENGLPILSHTKGPRV